MNIHSEISKFVDTRLSEMVKRPGMWGPPIALECECHLLVEFYDKFGWAGPERAIEPSGELYQNFRRTLYRGAGPLCLSDWLVHSDNPSRLETEHDVGVKIVEFFIDWKAFLVSNEWSQIGVEKS